MKDVSNRSSLDLFSILTKFRLDWAAQTTLPYSNWLRISEQYRALIVLVSHLNDTFCKMHENPQARVIRRGPPGSTIIILLVIVRFNNNNNHYPTIPWDGISRQGHPHSEGFIPHFVGGNISLRACCFTHTQLPALLPKDNTSWKHRLRGAPHEYGQQHMASKCSVATLAARIRTGRARPEIRSWMWRPRRPGCHPSGGHTGPGGQMAAQQDMWSAAAGRPKRYGDCGLEGMSAKCDGKHNIF